ncbi:MAG TPA: PAS domain-containing protein [Acidobacteriota bacterium]|nr:PAS domain-containing protein [Acidobacteriota bacterium]
MRMEDQKLYRIIAAYAPVLVWISGPDKLRIYFNKRWLDFTGRPYESELGNGWISGIHPDDVQRCLGIYAENFERRREFKMEFRLRRYDGEFRWVSETGVPFYETDGSFAGCVGSCFDITESTQDNARLIDAQEKERSRIARELHDDIGYSLSILGIEMLRAGKPVSGAPGQKHPEIRELYRKMQEIALRVSRLSRQLHSPTLEYFGLAKAIEAECREFSERYHIPVACSCSDIPAMLDPAIALSFLRVVQEAFHNAAKHSQATHIILSAIATAEGITLRFSDDGIGFDVEQSRLAAGLGLISMRERMRLIGGEFEIWSEPGKGTKIYCRALPAQSSETVSTS